MTWVGTVLLPKVAMAKSTGRQPNNYPVHIRKNQAVLDQASFDKLKMPASRDLKVLAKQHAEPVEACFCVTSVANSRQRHHIPKPHGALTPFSCNDECAVIFDARRFALDRLIAGAQPHALAERIERARSRRPAMQATPHTGR